MSHPAQRSGHPAGPPPPGASQRCAGTPEDALDYACSLYLAMHGI
ncbi:hypothetical protein OG535_39815 [Kitasatospora sp. NBC_00085]